MLKSLKESLIAPMLFMMALVTLALPAAAAPYATDWIDGHNSRTRLIVGGRPADDGKVERFVALEIALAPGWKTYWRQPGSAGGIPPHVTWQKSTNLKKVEVEFPAPRRFVDPSGETIGYKNSVTFPLRVVLDDTDRPLGLRLEVFYGVCREICIPVQAAFEVAVSPELFRQTPPELAAALAKVPVKVKASIAPALSAVRKVERAGGAVVLEFDVRYPGTTADADLFAETGDGQPLEMSKLVARPGKHLVRFEVPVADATEWRQLGKSGLRLTIVGESGASEASVPRP